MVYVNWDTRTVLSESAFNTLVDKEAKEYFNDRSSLKDYISSIMDIDELVDAVADNRWDDILEDFAADCDDSAYGALLELYEEVVPLDEAPFGVLPFAE